MLWVNVKKIRELSFTTEHAVEEILRAMEFSKIREIRVIDHITKIYAEMLEGVEVVRSVENKTENISNGNCGPDVSVIMNYNASASDEALLDFLRNSNRSFSLRLIVKSQDVMIDVSDLIKGKIVQLHFSQPSFLFAEKTIETCQRLTHLAFTNLVKFKEDVFTTLCGAVTSEKLPKVKYLTFYSCRDSIKGKLGMLFKKPWLTLTHFNVGDCCLYEEDTKIICAAAQNAQKNNLPELRSLILTPNYLEISNDIRLFEGPWEKLSSLILMTAFLRSSEEGVGYKSFLGALKQGIFPNLVELGTSQWSADIFGQLNSLRNISFGVTKSNFQTARVDVQHLVEKCPLSNLVNIDLSYSSLSSNLPYLVCQRFPKLDSLVLAHSGLYNLHCLGEANAQDRFPSLQCLDVSKNFCSSDSLFRIETDWKQLEVVHVGIDHGWALSCQSIASMIEKKHLKRLK